MQVELIYNLRMTEKKGLKDAYSLKTPEDSINLYKTWASTYDDDFAKQNDYRSPIEIAKYSIRPFIFIELLDKPV